MEMNQKLKGILDQIRKPTLFRGEFGETILLVPPVGSLTARKLLIIGLGDTEGFSPQRMELIGSIAYRESNRLGIAHPFFAPTILDGGVTKFTTDQVSEKFVTGFLRGARTENVLKIAGASVGQEVRDLTFLAGVLMLLTRNKGLKKASPMLLSNRLLCGDENLAVSVLISRAHATLGVSS